VREPPYQGEANLQRSRQLRRTRCAIPVQGSRGRRECVALVCKRVARPMTQAEGGSFS
jgi:hypothetical protein